jgi:hypothetical protein
MRRGLVALVVVVSVVSSSLAGVCAAQGDESPAPSAETLDMDAVLVEGVSEWSAGIGLGVGIGRSRASNNSKYTFQTLSWGRVLTGPAGPPVLRGRFEWAVEVMPIFGQFSPDRAWGVGISPLVWRWNLERPGRLAPFAQVGGGGLWTNTPVPAGTERGNFMAHAMLGFRRLTSAQRAIIVAYRYDHISNGNRGTRNPGVNAHVIYFGWTMFRPARR